MHIFSVFVFIIYRYPFCSTLFTYWIPSYFNFKFNVNFYTPFDLIFIYVFLVLTVFRFIVFDIASTFLLHQEIDTFFLTIFS